VSRALCPHCHTLLTFGTDLDGRLLEACRCGERLVPTTGAARDHDQRGRLDAELTHGAQVGMRPVGTTA
jgi:hypothetical protein